MPERRVSGLASRAALLALVVLPVSGMAGDTKGPAPYGAQDPAANQRWLASAGPERVKQFAALLKFCDENPKATFADAVVTLWNSLQGPAGTMN